MSIYDPLSNCLGIEPNPNLFHKIFIEKVDSIDIPNQYNPQICKEEAIKRNTNIVRCDRCGVEGGEPNMRRWHFDNCKTILKNCQQCNKIIPRQNIKNHLYKQKKFCNKDCYYKSKIGKAPILMTDEIKKKLSNSAFNQSKDRSNRMKKNKTWLKSNRWKK
jgi:hypothetical protein